MRTSQLIQSLLNVRRDIVLHPSRFPICGFCGKNTHERKNCYAENPCSNCGKCGHFAFQCRTKKSNKAPNRCVRDISELLTNKSYCKLSALLDTKTISVCRSTPSGEPSQDEGSDLYSDVLHGRLTQKETKPGFRGSIRQGVLGPG